MIDEEPLPLPQDLRPGMILGVYEGKDQITLVVDKVEPMVGGGFNITYTWTSSRLGGRHDGITNTEFSRAERAAWPAAEWYVVQYIIEELPA